MGCSSCGPQGNALQARSLGKRIGIFGGGGKTTLASAVATKLGVPHIELDAIKHGPNWTERPSDEVARIVEQRLDESGEGWVTDGNYRRVRPIVLSRADTVVVIQIRFAVMFWRILKRSIRPVPAKDLESRAVDPPTTTRLEYRSTNSLV